MTRYRELLIFVSLAALGVAGRLAPHPPNCTPLAAIALFGGFLFVSRRVAAVAVIIALWIPEIWLGSLEPAIAASVAIGLLLPIHFGGMLKKKLTPGRVFAAVCSSSLLFYALTNAAVWAFGNWYPNDLEGFRDCMAAGIPFLKNTFSGDLVWSALLFSGYAMAQRVGTRTTQSNIQSY